MLPVLMLIGVMMGFSVFFMFRVNEMSLSLENPFYGRLGLREMYLMSLHNRIEGDLFQLDLVAKYSFYDTIFESSNSFYLEAGCGNYMGTPIVNHGCLSERSFSEISNNIRRKMNLKLYSRFIESNINFPYNYDFYLVQNGPNLEISGYSQNTIRFPIDVRDFSRTTPVGIVFSDSFLISQDCTYLGPNANERLSDSSYVCENNICTGPCPEEIEYEVVPYFNQCNVRSCERGLCTFDTGIICSVGCGFKSIQMAYAHYGFLFDESMSSSRNNILDLLDDMRANKPNSIIETQEFKLDSTEYTSVRIGFSNGVQDVTEIANEITDENYDIILEKLNDGLVRIKLSHAGPRNCEAPNSDLGYCVNSQHYVLVVGGNEDYLIIQDPYTSSRDFRTGINVVVSKEFIKNSWTGHYRQIRGVQN